MRTRDAVIAELETSAAQSVLIVGGGINGVGIYRDLAQQGVPALLVDRGDFCSGTSAAPSRLIHGGLRYLETGEFSLVRESVEERNLLLLNAPHYVMPIRVWLPTRNWTGGALTALGRYFGLVRTPGPKGVLVVKLGLTFYDLLGAKHRSMPRHRLVPRSEVARVLSGLSTTVRAVAEYHDAKVTHPERLVLELIADAERDSPISAAIPYLGMERLEGGRVVVRDMIDGRRFSVAPRIVVNATGAWVDHVDRSLGIDSQLVGGTKGSHLVLHHRRLAESLADVMLYFETADHRLCLAYALDGERVLLGTTDIRTSDPDDTVCSDTEIDYLFDVLASILPGVRLDRSDIVFTFAGVRPLPATDADVSGAITRGHSITVFEPTTGRDFRVLTLVGGKWTTYRSCAEQITDTVLSWIGTERRCSTTRVAIGGGVGWPRDAEALDRTVRELAIHGRLEPARSKSLLRRYGMHATAVVDAFGGQHETMLSAVSDYSVQEIAYLAANERIGRLADVLFRRTLIAFEGRATNAAITEVGRVVGGVLGWSTARLEDEIAATLNLVAKRHGVPRG